MRFKQDRLGPRLVRAARDASFFDQVHVVIGGTGAVGGATVLQLISMFEEALRCGAPRPGAAPRVLVTARSKAEIRGFTTQLYRLSERDHRREPERVAGVGYRTVGGVLLELRTFGIDPAIPELSGFAVMNDARRAAAVSAFLTSSGLPASAGSEQRAAAFEAAVEERVAHPFRAFLTGVAAELPAGSGRPFRSVCVGIPMASVATYKLGDLETAGPHLGIDPGSARMQELKDRYIAAVVDDLAQVSATLADEVVVAHTTAVGGMYDEEAGERRVIRLGFAHSAKGELLRDKQDFARKLTALYSARDIKMLITAAAIGIDAILRRERVPLNGRVRQKLEKALADGFELVPRGETNFIRVVPPVETGLEDGSAAPVHFGPGQVVAPAFVCRSGENGYFSVANADALYRVMRVTSSTELGLVMARTALFGDNAEAPLFPDNVCYYTETDNSRQVFDLLADPPLLRDQLSGLGPKALQDLGSAKHQGELHTLGLLTLLVRLLNLDVESIPRYGDPRAFEPAAYFEAHSPEVTLERAIAREPAELSRALAVLASAREPSELLPLLRLRPAHEDSELVGRVLAEVLRAVSTITSLGSPILLPDGRVRCGPFVAPLDCVLTHGDTLSRTLHDEFARCGGGDEAAWRRFLEFHVAAFGFVDLRPQATLVTARSADEGLEGKVQVFADEDALRAGLAALEPYSYFATSGLVALHVRLRALARMARDYDLVLGSANEQRAHLVHDHSGRALLVPGVVEAFRMVWEGLEKNTGAERLDGGWGYPPA
jgi:hypothetical protein